MTGHKPQLPLRCLQLQRVISAMAAAGNKPRFDRVLGLTSRQLHPDQATYDTTDDDKVLTVRLPVTSRITWPITSTTTTSSKSAAAAPPRPLLSTYLSLIDDVTTWALFEANVPTGRMGVSLSLTAQDLRIQQQPQEQPQQQVLPETEVDIIARVQKMGRTVAFLDATVRDVRSGASLIQASHIKYLGTMGWFRDLAVSKQGFEWTTWYYNATTMDPHYSGDDDNDVPVVASVFDSLEYDSTTQIASFETSNYVSNEFGTLHGGAHATLVELAAQQFVKDMHSNSRNNDAPVWVLESIQMEYQSAAPLFRPVQVKIDSSYMKDYSHKTSASGSLWVKVNVTSNGRICSSGLCQFISLTTRISTAEMLSPQIQSDLQPNNQPHHQSETNGSRNSSAKLLSRRKQIGPLGYPWLLLLVMVSFPFASAFSQSRYAVDGQQTVKRRNTLAARIVLRDNFDDGGEVRDDIDVFVEDGDPETAEARLLKKRSKSSLLLVDDEEDILLAVGDFLTDSGYGHVATCDNAISAYKMLTEDDTAPRFDLVISDVRMPEMDGIQFLNTLRSNPQTVGLPVILLTAKGQTMDRITGYNAGADAYIPKPFDPKELVSIVDSLLDKQELLATPDVNLQDLQSDLREIKDLLLRQGGGGSLVPGFVQATDVFLPPDEQEVLELLSKGKTNKEIAQETYLSTRRVEQLLTRMYRKADVSNRTELVRWAVATGNVRLND